MKMRITILALAMAVTPQTRAAINRAFRPDNFEIVWTTTPLEAIEESTRRPPDLVLLDLGQPVQAGQTTMRNLRELHPGAPMVILANDPPPYQEVAADEKITILYKPFGAAILAHAATELLNTSADNPPSKQSNPTDVDNAITGSQRFREMLLARYNAPFTPSYRHWGINE